MASGEGGQSPIATGKVTAPPTGRTSPTGQALPPVPGGWGADRGGPGLGELSDSSVTVYVGGSGPGTELQVTQDSLLCWWAARGPSGAPQDGSSPPQRTPPPPAKAVLGLGKPRCQA